MIKLAIGQEFRRDPRPEACRILAVVLVLTAAAPIFGDNITGGAVTVGSALAAGVTFVDLGVPWGSISTPANTVGNT